MAKAPAVMLYTADFLVGAIDMSMEERGQYITMLCLQHQKGHLSEKTINACIPGVSDDVLAKFDRDENGCYFNKKMDEEINRRNSYSESRGRNRNKPSSDEKSEDSKNICNSYDSENFGTSDENDMSFSKSYENHMENEDEYENEYNTENENGNNVNKQNKCPFSKIQELYHEICVSFPRIVSVNGERRKAVSARWRAAESLDVFAEMFRIAESSAFLKGQNDRNWHADFDWMMKPTNFSKILEHKYDNDSSEVSSGYGDPDAFFDAAVKAGMDST